MTTMDEHTFFSLPPEEVDDLYAAYVRGPLAVLQYVEELVYAHRLDATVQSDLWRENPHEPPPVTFLCPACGFMVDTPNHEYGCVIGRREYGHD
jgi:hypothetical protein